MHTSQPIREVEDAPAAAARQTLLLRGPCDTIDVHAELLSLAYSKAVDGTPSEQTNPVVSYFDVSVRELRSLGYQVELLSSQVIQLESKEGSTRDFSVGHDS